MKIKLVLGLVLAVFLAACSPQERIARIAKKYNLYQIDTLHFKDTVYIPSRTIGTQAVIDNNGYFQFQNKEIAYSGQVQDSFIYIKIVTPPDTIYREKTIPTTKIEIREKTKTKTVFPVVSFLLCFLGGYVILTYVINKIKQG
jgi:hypothetical protein